MPDLSQFHFLHPLWLLGLIPLGLLWWALWRQRGAEGSAWQKLIDPQLLPYLLVRDGAGAASRSRFSLYLLASGWLLALLALANPVWQQIPQPVYQQPEAQVIVLDLSFSMMAQDPAPSRLAQARFKVEDLLRNSRGKQTGLVVYAGDAYTVTPLTTDMATLESQLRVLDPRLMPLAGNRPEQGLQQAGELLKQAGLPHGHIILLADEPGDAAAEARRQVEQGYQVSVLGMGTAAGAPIPGRQDKAGKPLMSRVDNAALQAIATAGDGHFAAYSSDLQDVTAILAADRQTGLTQTGDATQQQFAQRWEENGPWLAMLLLPLAALAFRRGWLLTLAFITLIPMTIPQPAMAAGWQDLWQRPDQQAAAALAKKAYGQAAAVAPGAAQRGAAEYLAGDYAKASESFQQQEGAEASYNLGNALAKQGQYEKAIQSYDQALKRQPGMADAVHNRKLVEDLLKQQQQAQDQKRKDQEKKEQKGKGQQNNNQANSGQGQQDKSQQDSAGDKKDSSDQQAQQQAGDKTQDKKPSDQQQAKGQQQGKDQQDQQEKRQAQTDPAQSPSDKEDAAKEPAQFDQAGDKAQQQQAQQAVKEAEQSAKEKPSKTGNQARQDDEDNLNPEQRQAVENWLRRVPDDPGGLLRRKFLYQYRLRQQQAARR